MVEYAKKYLNLVQLDYKVIWWKLFNAVDATQWSNILCVIELLFCLPMANGHLKRVFSQLKLVKNTRRTSIREDTLDQVLRINVDGPPVSEWNAAGALDLWLREKTRRINQPASHASRNSTRTETVDEDQEESFCLDNWEDWMDLSHED